MVKKIDRRDFLKFAAGIGVSTGIVSSARKVVIEPFVRPPEEELPGRATWYATTCRQCPAGCGVIARVINGRPRKLEGNPAHPLNRGKLCARGQAGLQYLYNPDRVQNPLRQSGGRGSREFAPLQWSDALESLATILSNVDDPSKVAFLSGLMPDHIHQLTTLFQTALGAPPPVIYDLHSVLDGRTAIGDLSNRWFGSSNLPIYDISQAEVVFSFGANFLETWMSPVSQSVDFGNMRQGQLGGRGFFVQFEPRLSATGASADEWVPVKPGTEGLIALGIGRIIVENNLGRVGSQREFADLYRNVSPQEVADQSGIPLEKLSQLAQIFANADQSVAIPGGLLTGMSNPADALDAVMALNVIMRRLGREGGVFLPQELSSDVFSSHYRPSSFSELQDLINRMNTGNVEVLFVHGTNPVYDLPVWTGFAHALKNVTSIISFSSFVDETAAQADLILPDHTYLESWGFQVLSPGADHPVVSGFQPVVRPLYNTQSTADVLLALSARLGGTLAESLPWQDEVAYIEEQAATLIGSSIGVFDAPTTAGFWSRWRQFGGWWSEKPIRQEPDAVGLPQEPLSVEPSDFAGDEEEYPFYLLPYESTSLSDGRGANQPLLQEAPDPMTTARWNSWIELNPDTAKQLGLSDNDLVRVTSPTAEMDLPVVIYPAIRPDVVAIPTGQGHTDYGRFAGDRGVNVMHLISPTPESVEPSLNWSGTRVRLKPLNVRKEIARLENLDGEGRESIR
jgi:anaerobic selenocysteine-containing dehydrogenase